LFPCLSNAEGLPYFELDVLQVSCGALAKLDYYFLHFFPAEYDQCRSFGWDTRIHWN